MASPLSANANGEGRGNSPLSAFFHPQTVVPEETLRENSLWSLARYPEVRPVSNPEPLAVVGGGMSARKHLERLKSWPGEIWAVKGACKWLASEGVGSVYFSAHPVPDADTWQPERAILSSACDPETFRALKCPIEVFRSEFAPPPHVIGSVTSLSKAPALALSAGYREIHIFGADSSAEGDSHAYENRRTGKQVRVRCGGRVFDTQADWVWQAEWLVEFFRLAPRNVINRSEGFVTALLEHGEYEVIR